MSRSGSVTLVTGIETRPLGSRIAPAGSPVAITSVGFEFADAEPTAFRAVTTTRSRFPTSSFATIRVWPVSPGMFVHEAPAELHRCHWYVYEVGLFDQVPFAAVRV